MGFAYAGGVLTQTGTDTDLSGLNGLTGVTRFGYVTTGSQIYYIYDIGTNRLDIEGDLTINPEYNMLLTNCPTGTAPNFSINVRANATLTIGEKTVVGSATKYTTGTAIIATEQGNLNTNGSLLVEANGTLQAYGALIELSGPTRIRVGATLTVEDLTVVNARNDSCQFRIEAQTIADVAKISITKNGITLNGKSSNDSCRLTTSGNVNPFDSNSFIFKFVRAQYQPGSGGYPPQVFLNFDNGNNVDSADFAYAGSGGTGGTQFDDDLVDFRNVARRLRYTNANTKGGFCKTTRNVNFALQDASGAGLSTITYYAIDVDNGSRINFNGFDSTADIVYSGQNAGPTLALNITAEFMAGENTTRHIDSRTNGDDTILFRFVGYETNITSSSPVLIGLGDLDPVVVNATDALIAETSKVTVDAYTELETPEKFYDRAKAYLVDNYAGEASTIVSRNGNTIDAGSYDVVVDATAGTAFDLTGNTITIHADVFTGDITTTGTVALSNGAVVLGTRTDNGGTITTSQYSITGLVADSRVQIYNVTADNEFSNAVVVGTSVTDYYVDGVDFSSGDSIRVRITNVQGTTAYEEYEAQAIATASGWGIVAIQVPCPIYNGWGLDGSTITKFTPDYVNDEVDVAVASDFEARELGAWWAYNLYTEQGLREFYGGITFSDEANLRINDTVVNIYLDNTTTTNINQTDNRRVFRDDGLRPVTNPTTGGGGIDVEWRSPVTIANVEGVSANVEAILQDTNELQQNQGDWATATGFATPTDVTDSETAITSAISGLNDPTVQEIVDGVWDEPLTGATHNLPTSAGRRLRQASVWLSAEGSFVDTPTTTTLPTDLTQATTSFYADQTMVIVSGSHAGQARIITNYDGTTKTITIDEPFTSPPSAGDEFAIFANHVHSISQIQEGLATRSDVYAAGVLKC